MEQFYIVVEIQHRNVTLRVHAVVLLFYLFVFQMWIVSSSTLLCFTACSSRKSKKYLTAGGTTAPEHSTLRKKSSTNCCSVPWKQIMWDRAETQNTVRHTKDKRYLPRGGHSSGLLACVCFSIFKMALSEKHWFEKQHLLFTQCDSSLLNKRTHGLVLVSVPLQKGVLLDRSL